MVWGRGLILLFSMWIQVVLMEKNPQGNSKISLLLCACLDFRFIFESVLAFCVFLGICLFHLGCLINWHIIVTVLSCFSHVWLSVTLWSVALCPWDSLGKNTGVGFHSHLQRIFPTRDQAQVSCIAGRFFTIWNTLEAHGIKQIKEL